MTLRGEGNVHIEVGRVYGTPRCHVSRVADLVPVPVPSLETQCTNNAHYYVVTATQVRLPGSARYHITSNYLFTYGKRDESKMCGRRGSTKRRMREINKPRRHLMKTRSRKIEQDE